MSLEWSYDIRKKFNVEGQYSQHFIFFLTYERVIYILKTCELVH